MPTPTPTPTPTPAPSQHRAVRDHCLAPSRAVDAPIAGVGGKYGRLFPELPPLETDEDLLYRLGGSGGICDGGPVAVDAAGGDDTSGDNAGDDAGGPAGWPFFGQFVAHDITADRSLLLRHADAAHLANFRSPRANLECLYDDGPTGSPFLYERDDSAKLLIGRNDRGEPADLPRNQQGVALIGDPRNDVHLFVNQLHVAMLKVHNGLVDRLRADGEPEEVVFESARRSATWHYQWVIVHDYLPAVAGAELVAELLADGPRFYRPDGPAWIPLEFADGAFRYGHSQIRHAYRLRDGAEPKPLFPDLLGFAPVPAAHTVDWSRLFRFPGGPVPQRAKKIDGRLARSLIELPRAITGAVDVAAFHSLAVRDLQRGQAYGLPSGETVARAMGEAPLAPDETGMKALGWEGDTPLWYYVLKEAEAREGGERLGPVGGRIVAEVLLGIIDADPESWRSVDRAWRPTLPAADADRFTVTDLLAFATT